jgi:hypothetical protein
MNLTHLDMSRNRKRYLDNSVFRKQGQLETLILSENVLQILGSDLFTDCTNLTECVPLWEQRIRNQQFFISQTRKNR